MIIIILLYEGVMHMIDKDQGNKAERVLEIYSRLMDGNVINKAEEAKKYEVNERTIQRDIKDIGQFIDKSSIDSGFINKIVYDRTEKGYRLDKVSKMKLTNGEILGICKILLDSRAFTKSEMMSIIDKLLENCVPKLKQKMVTELIRNEQFHYVELRHKVSIVDRIWEIGMAIKESRYLNIQYLKASSSELVGRKVKPVALMFSEYYFYLAAYIEGIDKEKEFINKNDSFPTIYRLDRIKEYEVSDQHFRVPYVDRFQEGEFRKRVQFMYGGRLRKITFKYKGYDIDAILDRLPTAKIIDKDDKGWMVEAEVFGDGIDMWMRSQGDYLEILDTKKRTCLNNNI